MTTTIATAVENGAVNLSFNPTAVASGNVGIGAVSIGSSVAPGTLIGVTVGSAVEPIPAGDPLILTAGTIDLEVVEDDRDGEGQWSLVYEPLDDGAYVVAA